MLLTPIPGVRVWHVYCPDSKTDLWSTAIELEGGWWLVDPTPLPPEFDFDKIAGVILTNTNHDRDSAFWTERNVSIYGHSRPVEESCDVLDLPPEFMAIAIPGAVTGEIALLIKRDDATICVIGDAVINMPPKFPLMLLPDKYSEDPALLLRSARVLLQHPCDLICFAHGEPLVGSDAGRLASLFE